MRLILASASPRRAELLRAAGFTFETVVVDVDERVRVGEPPQQYVRRLAAEKSATAVARAGAELASATDVARVGAELASAPRHEGPTQCRPLQTVILSADTAVVVDGEILGKPRDDAEAADMLRRLSGRWHEVMTGFSLRCGAQELGRVETTRVQFAPLGDAEVSWYVESGEGRDKAGAYAIQGLASRFVTRIEGSYSNVVGLPVAAVFELLTELQTSYSDC